MSNKPSRRIVTLATPVTELPPVEALIADAMSIIQDELIKFKTKVRKGQSLDANEGRLLNGYIKSLVELCKENRERDKDVDLANLTDEDLLKLYAASSAKKAAAAEIPSGRVVQETSSDEI